MKYWKFILGPLLAVTAFGLILGVRGCGSDGAPSLPQPPQPPACPRSREPTLSEMQSWLSKRLDHYELDQLVGRRERVGGRRIWVLATHDRPEVGWENPKDCIFVSKRILQRGYVVFDVDVARLDGGVTIHTIRSYELNFQ